MAADIAMSIAEWAPGFCIAATGFHFASLFIAARRLRVANRASPLVAAAPPVTVLRPLCGIDNFAAETLVSTFRIDYPEYELIFCVARADDPVVPIVRDLIELHPQRPARLLIGDDRISDNPKLNNIVKGWNAARHDWIIVADSNVLISRDFIRRFLARWEPKSGAICSMPIGARPLNFWAELECAFLNTLQARVQYVSEALGFGFAQGKSILFRREVIERAGGLRALAIDLAEDAATTKIVRAAGLRIHLVDQPVCQPLGWRTPREVWLRQLRWARLRRASFPWLFLPEIFLGSAGPTVFAAVAAAAAGMNVAAAVALMLSLWLAAELLLAKRVGWHLSARMAAALLLRDMMLPALWLAAVLGGGFNWRGNEMTTKVSTGRGRALRWVRNTAQLVRVGPEL